jgi:hypothetical protein
VYKESNQLPPLSHREIIGHSLDQLSEFMKGDIDIVEITTLGGLVKVSLENYRSLRENLLLAYWRAADDEPPGPKQV